MKWQQRALALAWLVAGCRAQVELDLDSRQSGEGEWRCAHERIAAALAGAANLTSVSAAEALAANLTSCEELHLDALVLADAAPLAAALAAPEAATATLRVVNIDGSAILDAGATVLAAPLGAAASSLRALHAHNIRIGDEGAAALAHALNGHPSLRLLDLNGNFIGDAGAAAIGRLLRAPAPPAVVAPLGDLRLHDNLIGPVGAAALAEAAASNSVLTSLMLSGNPISDDGAVALANVLRHPDRALRRLYLANTGIGETGAQALLTMLRSAERPLEVLDLEDNPAVPRSLLNDVRAELAARAPPAAPPPPIDSGAGVDAPSSLSTATGVFRYAGG